MWWSFCSPEVVCVLSENTLFQSKMILTLNLTPIFIILALTYSSPYPFFNLDHKPNPNLNSNPNPNPNPNYNLKTNPNSVGLVNLFWVRTRE